VYQGRRSNGRYADVAWNGLDDHGDLVPPGVYLVHIRAEGDSQQEERVSTVGVAY
jgi:hypothetical protein